MDGTSVLTMGVLVARLIVGSLFILAGWLKMRSGTGWFYLQILEFRITGRGFARTLSLILPPLEIGLGVFLVLGLFTQWVSIISFVLLFSFTAVVLHASWLGRSTACGCFGRRDNRTSKAQWRVICRNIILMGLLLLLYITSQGAIALGPLGIEQLGGEHPLTWVAIIALILWVSQIVALLFVHKRLAKQSEEVPNEVSFLSP